MWQQNYTPVANSLPLSALVAAIPIFALLILLGVMRKPAWMASLVGLGAAALVAAGVYGMPLGRLFAAATCGAAFGLLPIGYVVFAALLLYRVTLESGKFDLLKDSIGHITEDARLQALLIAFAFGAFIEGATGFGTPVAVAAAMLVGLGFVPFYAAAICLLANTAGVAFGAIGIPVATLAVTTGLPLERLSAAVARICTPASLFVPAYLILVMYGRKGLRGVLPAVAVCGIAYTAAQLVVSNSVLAPLTGVLAGIAALIALVILLRVWKPRDSGSSWGSLKVADAGQAGGASAPRARHTAGEIAHAWAPYALLVVCVLLWGYKPFQAQLNRVSIAINWPGLNDTIERMPPVVAKPSPYAATYNFNWLATSGTGCLVAAFLGAIAAGLKPRQFARAVGHTAKQLALAELTLAVVLGLAFVMNYSGATATLGLAFAATGVLFPFFSSLLGWLGVFLTGSDTSANALFGTLQVVTAGKLGMSPVLMAAANSAGGVMGKMISLTSIAVAAAATSMKREEEYRLFRFTLKHSVLLAFIIGLTVMFIAYVAPGWVP
ncbi:MAG: lactate permease LctP family transporter [Bryobacteraceae bacterium]|jgi:lactate permease